MIEGELSQRVDAVEVAHTGLQSDFATVPATSWRVAAPLLVVVRKPQSLRRRSIFMDTDVVTERCKPEFVPTWEPKMRETCTARFVSGFLTEGATCHPV